MRIGNKIGLFFVFLALALLFAVYPAQAAR